MFFFSLPLSIFALHFCSPVAVHPQNDVLDKLNLLWKFVKPISFALIGKEVLFSKLDAQLVGYGVLIVIIGSSVSHFGSIAKSFYFIDLLNTRHSNWLYIFEVIFAIINDLILLPVQFKCHYYLKMSAFIQVAINWRCLFWTGKEICKNFLHSELESIFFFFHKKYTSICYPYNNSVAWFCLMC